jgi:hypothetical protein
MDGFRSQLSLGLEPQPGGSKISETLSSAGLGSIEFEDALKGGRYRLAIEGVEE